MTCIMCWYVCTIVSCICVSALAPVCVLPFPPVRVHALDPCVCERACRLYLCVHDCLLYMCECAFTLCVWSCLPLCVYTCPLSVCERACPCVCVWACLPPCVCARLPPVCVHACLHLLFVLASCVCGLACPCARYPPCVCALVVDSCFFGARVGYAAVT